MEGGKMARINILLLALGVVLLSTTVNAEFAKEGSGEYKLAKSGLFELLKLGENRVQMNWSESGVIVIAPENSPFYNATFYVMGTLHSIDGKYKANGGAVFTNPNGDQIFGVVDSEGILGGQITGGVITLTGGTGSLEGIQGEMTAGQRPNVKSSKKGTYQGLGNGSISWKLP